MLILQFAPAFIRTQFGVHVLEVLIVHQVYDAVSERTSLSGMKPLHQTLDLRGHITLSTENMCVKHFTAQLNAKQPLKNWMFVEKSTLAYRGTPRFSACSHNYGVKILQIS